MRLGVCPGVSGGVNSQDPEADTPFQLHSMKTPPAQLHAGIHTPRPIACWDTQGNIFTCVCLSTSEGPQLLLRTVKISDSRNTKELL